MSPEEKAAAVIAECWVIGDRGEDELSMLMLKDAIAVAIRQARTEAIEEAARVAACWKHGPLPGVTTQDGIAAAIRALSTAKP